jgi:hypothetical protein
VDAPLTAQVVALRVKRRANLAGIAIPQRGVGRVPG